MQLPESNLDRLGHYVVLVIDDEPDLLEATKAAIESDTRIRVVTATNARDAYDLVQAREPDLVLTDHNMPGTTGLDIVTRLLTVRPGMVTAMLSGAADLDVVTKALNGGHIQAFFRKPVGREELVSKIGELLRARQDAIDRQRGTEQAFASMRSDLSRTGKDPGRPFTGRLGD